MGSTHFQGPSLMLVYPNSCIRHSKRPPTRTDCKINYLRNHACGRRSTSHPYDGVTNLPTDIPKIQAPKVLHCSAKAPSSTIPGPGHIPDQPHPTPKITLPTINFQSIPWVSGRLNFAPNSGLLANWSCVVHARIFGTTPPIATNARDGSKFGDMGRARKFRILDGWSIPASASPNAKWTATVNEEMFRYHFVGASRGMMNR